MTGRYRILEFKMSFIEILKVILFGIVEGYTEFLPISSTGHLILVENLVHLNQPEDFFEVFKVVIQLGAILSVVVLYWDKLWPFSKGRTDREKRETLELWVKIAVAIIPAVVIGLLFDDFLEEHLSTPIVIGITLIAYGIAFIALEKLKHDRTFRIRNTRQISLRTALCIGLFQCLSLIPGTSRSGATILGAMLLGVNRAASAEFSFFLGIPVMGGASLLKIVKHGLSFSGTQWFLLILGTFISFAVALYAIRYLMNYVRKHSFTVFGWYRIVLGIAVLIYFGAAL